MTFRTCTCFVSFLLLVVLPAASQTENNKLREIRAELELIRAEAPQHADTRGASPRFAKVKHLLRDWVEQQLSGLPSDRYGEDGAEVKLAERLNDQLQREHLFRETKPGETVDEWKMIGFLKPLRLEYQHWQAYLVLQTGIEVNCGADESAYLYRWRDGHWTRIWETEQNTYTKKDYLVQYIHAVLVSPPFDNPAPHVMTLGTRSWCSSNWYPFYTRIWTVEPAGVQPKLLLDHVAVGYLGAHDIPVMGSIGREDALIEYRVGSIDVDVHNRAKILHYSIKGNTIQRIDPIALGPRDFVEEWLGAPWEQSVHWSQAANVVALKKAHADKGRDQFQTTRRCDTPDLWQVGLESLEENEPPMYYIVRWRPPYHFTMVSASQATSPDCKKADLTADEERTLFPVQDWRE